MRFWLIFGALAAVFWTPGCSKPSAPAPEANSMPDMAQPTRSQAPPPVDAPTSEPASDPETGPVDTTDRGGAQHSGGTQPPQ